MIVADASAVVCLLIDGGAHGDQARAQYAAHDLAYPALLPFEVTNVLRRLEHRGTVERAEARRAIRRLGQLRGHEYAFDDVATRVWELRQNLSAYDAAYVALAELIDRPLLTFDRRLQGAPGTRCQFVDTR